MECNRDSAISYSTVEDIEKKASQASTATKESSNQAAGSGHFEYNSHSLTPSESNSNSECAENWSTASTAGSVSTFTNYNSVPDSPAVTPCSSISPSLGIHHPKGKSAYFDTMEKVEIAHIRKELVDATKLQRNILDLCEDELRQLEAKEKREKMIQEKVPSNINDRLEHGKEVHMMHEKEKVEHMLDEKHEHELKQDGADTRRAEFLASRVDKAKHLSGH